MATIKVWDYPVRVFHWTLVICFFSATGLALLASEHSQLFDVHKLLGLILAPMILLRVVWGLFGTKHARFASFSFSPKSLVEYLSGLVTLKGKHYVGHNPAASYAIVAMILLLAATVVSGIMIRGAEIFEEIHEVAAFVSLAVVGAHLAGVALHVVRHKENIALSMFSGKKEGNENEAISSSRPIMALVFIALMSSWAVGVFSGYDRQTQRVEIPIVGVNIDIGEGQEREHGQ